MNVHHTIRALIGNPALERLELQDVSGPDLTAGNVQDADAFPPDELTDREIDALYEAEMARRDAEAAVVFGGDDTDPTRPGSAVLTADSFAEGFAAYSDDNLALAVDCLDRDVVENVSEEHRLLMLDAATAEVLRRLGCGCRRAA